MSTPLLQVFNLSVHYPIRSGLLQRPSGVVKALDDVSLKIEKGSTLGLVGESGSGKTTLGRVIVRLVDPTHGSVSYQGEPITLFADRNFGPIAKRFKWYFRIPTTR